MAPKKSTKSTTKKEETKKETPKAKKTIQLTFAPMLSAATQYKMLLRKKVEKDVNGDTVLVNAPLIDGLPVEVIVKKGQIFNVTQEQYEALQNLGYVESDEDYARRQAYIKTLPPQHPDEKIPWHSIEQERPFWISLKDSEMIYDDKLIRV